MNLTLVSGKWSLIRFALLHVATGQYMPTSTSRGHGGWSNWDPTAHPVIPKHGMDNAIVGSMRLFETNKGADNARVQWARGIRIWQSRATGEVDATGEYSEESWKMQDVGRERGMLEIVPMSVAPLRCPSCETHEVSLELMCHNSACKEYAKEQAMYEGWKKPA